MLHRQTLGTLRLEGPAGPALPGRRKALALLACLARRALEWIPRVELERAQGDALDVGRHCGSLAEFTLSPPAALRAGAATGLRVNSANGLGTTSRAPG